MTNEIHRASSLTQYFRMGNWTAFDAAHILSDVDPEYIGWSGMNSFFVGNKRELKVARVQHRLDTFTGADCPPGFYSISDRNPDHAPFVRKIEHSIIDKLYIMFSEWPDGFQDIKKAPEEWVKWALKKKYSINWLQWGICEKLLSHSLIVGDEIQSTVKSEESTPPPRYTPCNARREARKLDTLAMYASWKKAYRDLMKTRPNMSISWYSKQIEKMDIAMGRDAGTIKKKMKS